MQYKKTYKILDGNFVEITGIVGRYKAMYKKGGQDYCIETIVNVRSI